MKKIRSVLIGFLILENIPPLECSDYKGLCNMIISYRDAKDANKFDCEEGYCQCLLLNKAVLEGGNPECIFSQWQKKALEEYHAEESIRGISCQHKVC